MLELRVWKLVNWKVQIIDTNVCDFEPDIYYDEDVVYGDEIGMKRVFLEAIDLLDKMISEE